jgi:hypothetical protein
MLSPLFHHSTEILFPNKGIDALRRYDLLGPIARLCLQLTPAQLVSYISDRDNEIANSSPDLISKCFSNSARLSFDTLSHKICLIRRLRGSQLGEGRYTVGPLSDAVKQQVIQKLLEELSADQLLKLWAKFSRFALESDSRSEAKTGAHVAETRGK